MASEAYRAPEGGGESVTVAGTLKWFDPVKGYGFIAANDGSGDILIHQSVLRQEGHRQLQEGARITCEAVKRPKGMQATRIISIAEPEAPAGRTFTLATTPRVQPPPLANVHANMVDATIKWFNRAKGFGFATRGENTPDLFLHMETLRAAGIREVRDGQKVRVRLADGPKGQMVAEIALPPDQGDNA